MRSSSNTGIDQFPRHNSLKGNACVTKVTGIQFETLGLQLFEVNFFFVTFISADISFVRTKEETDKQTNKQTKLRLDGVMKASRSNRRHRASRQLTQKKYYSFESGKGGGREKTGFLDKNCKKTLEYSPQYFEATKNIPHQLIISCS